ncbi:WD repeat-containing protein RUP2 [Platanthera zijinensis]|uniref:WD repeat-containing protein RUP2 n=1 Tax=Platanthera zijinensis TaxID=2320716 RepID=A0AAP0GCB4_9ASPA
MSTEALHQSVSDDAQPERARREWDFRLSTVVSPPSSTASDASDVIGAVEIDQSDRLLATAGIARKIRIYTLAGLLPSDADLRHSSACDFYICAPAKLSSLRFRPGSGSRVIAAGDYDGVVTEYDLDRRTSISERDEHGGRRVWSVDYSPAGDMAASGSDNGAARIWDTRCPAEGTVVHNGISPVCCVEFDGADCGPLIALGCADRNAYVYDLRAVGAGPVSAFGGHARTVTYVRFVGGGRMLSSGTDGAHRMWEARGEREIRAYRGHKSGRSFVGMGLWRKGGLIGCGSETNEVFVYDLRWGEPIWVKSFGRAGAGFASAVCWCGGRDGSGGGDDCMLIAGGSDGVLQIFSGRRNSCRNIN